MRISNIFRIDKYTKSMSLTSHMHTSTAATGLNALKLLVLVAGLVIVAGVVWLWVATARPLPRVTMRAFSGQGYVLAEASTTKELADGLGGYSSLPIHEGMLFDFPQSAVQCFWMKDMHFALDMIWLNASKNVVFLKENVSPDTYPEAFCPPEPAKYVIELNAGQAKTASIHIGETLILQ